MLLSTVLGATDDSLLPAQFYRELALPVLAGPVGDEQGWLGSLSPLL